MTNPFTKRIYALIDGMSEDRRWSGRTQSHVSHSPEQHRARLDRRAGATPS